MSTEDKLQRLQELDRKIRAKMDSLDREREGWLLEACLHTHPDLKQLLQEFKKLNDELYPRLRSVRPTSQNDLNKN